MHTHTILPEDRSTVLQLLNIFNYERRKLKRIPDGIWNKIYIHFIMWGLLKV